MLTALNRPHELKAHVNGALRNGVTVEEIRGVLLQAAIYCGVPAALDSFRVASEAIKGYSAPRTREGPEMRHGDLPQFEIFARPLCDGTSATQRKLHRPRCARRADAHGLLRVAGPGQRRVNTSSITGFNEEAATARGRQLLRSPMDAARSARGIAGADHGRDHHAYALRPCGQHRSRARRPGFTCRRRNSSIR